MLKFWQTLARLQDMIQETGERSIAENKLHNDILLGHHEESGELTKHFVFSHFLHYYYTKHIFRIGINRMLFIVNCIQRPVP